MALYRPMWPVAEMMLTVLGNLLVMHFRSKTFDLSLRVAALDYLGIIAARLRKDRLHALAADATEQEKARLNSIVKSILFDEYSYDPSYNVEDIDIGHVKKCIFVYNSFDLNCFNLINLNFFILINFPSVVTK
jgi:hypothetical protein